MCCGTGLRMIGMCAGPDQVGGGFARAFKSTDRCWSVSLVVRKANGATQSSKTLERLKANVTNKGLLIAIHSIWREGELKATRR